MSIPIGRLRRLQNAYLPDVCDVARYAETNTPDGVSQGWTTVATAVPCRVSARTMTAVEGGGGGAQLRALSPWRVWLPALSDVTVKDRLLVTVEGAPPRTFEVERVEGESNETARACSAVEVT